MVARPSELPRNCCFKCGCCELDLDDVDVDDGGRGGAAAGGTTGDAVVEAETLLPSLAP